MSKTRKDRRDRDSEFYRKNTKREFSKSRKNRKFGRNQSAEDLIDEYTINLDEQ